MNKITDEETELSLLPQAPPISKSRGHGLLPTCNSIWIQHIINTHWSPRTESFAFPATALEWIGVGIKPLFLRVWIQNKWAWSRAVHARSERTGSKIPVNFLLRKLPSLLSLKSSGPGQSRLPCVLEERSAWWSSHLTFQGGRESPSMPDASRRPASTEPPLHWFLLATQRIKDIPLCEVQVGLAEVRHCFVFFHLTQDMNV